MDLRNQTITVAELLDDPKSKAEMAAVYLPKKTIQDTLRELQQL